MSIGFGAYGMPEIYGLGDDWGTGGGWGIPGVGSAGGPECDPDPDAAACCIADRAQTCGAAKPDGSSVCYDDRGCPVYSEGTSGRVEVIGTRASKVGQEFLQDRIRRAEETGEALTVEMLGKEHRFGGGMSTTTKLLIGGGILAVVGVGAFFAFGKPAS
jgi:hypothetical protein